MIFRIIFNTIHLVFSRDIFKEEIYRWTFDIGWIHFTILWNERTIRTISKNMSSKMFSWNVSTPFMNL